jgi:hypothetical protein
LRRGPNAGSVTKVVYTFQANTAFHMKAHKSGQARDGHEYERSRRPRAPRPLEDVAGGQADYALPGRSWMARGRLKAPEPLLAKWRASNPLYAPWSLPALGSRI